MYLARLICLDFARAMGFESNILRFWLRLGMEFGSI